MTSQPFISVADANFLLGNGPKITQSRPMIRTQGNGNYTGFVRQTYSDGLVVDAEFVMNAKTKAEVIEAYATSGMAA